MQDLTIVLIARWKMEVQFLQFLHRSTRYEWDDKVKGVLIDNYI